MRNLCIKGSFVCVQLAMKGPLTASTPVGYDEIHKGAYRVKFIAGIRLVLAAALMVLFTGTTAFAHAGHLHETASSSSSKAASSKAPNKQVSLPTLAAAIGAAAQLAFAPAPATGTDGPVFKASVRLSSNDCGGGACGSCCCCGGPSGCGMAGFCHVFAIPSNGQIDALIPDRSLIAIAASEVGAGGILSGLDRPPKF